MRRVSAICVVLAVSLAACGGDSGGGGGGGETGSGNGGSVGPIDAVRCAEVAAALASATSGATQALAGTVSPELQASIDELDQFAGEAPDEIAADIQVQSDAYAQVTTALEGANFDPASGQPPPPEVIAGLQEAGNALNTPEFQEANQRVSTWFAENCGTAPAP